MYLKFDYINFFFTIQCIVIVYEKSVVFFSSIFRNFSKTAETILIKKFRRNHDISVYKKALINEHKKKLYFSR